jgi:hypothetical protein
MILTRMRRCHNARVLRRIQQSHHLPPSGSADAGALSPSITANGAIASLSLRGHVLVDLCAALS